MIAGCASLPSVEDNQTGRQVIDVYDSKGNVKERMIIKDDYITIYDKDWKKRGMEWCKNSLEQSFLIIPACSQTPFGNTRLREALLRV